MTIGKHTYTPRVKFLTRFGIERKSRHKSKVVPMQGIVIVLLSVTLYLLAMGAVVTLAKFVMG